MIPQQTVDQILDTAQIADVVSDYVTLKRRGANYVACCPFHNEKTPSFYVSPSKGIFKCFGCGKSGTAVGFVMEQEHCSYTDALRYLARKYHIHIEEEELDAEEIARRNRNESLLLVCDFAQKWFASQLGTPQGSAVGLAYFRHRGLEDQTISSFGLGWAPSGPTALLDAARAAGYKEEYILDAGLAVKTENGSLKDKFRERVMFPIHSVSGRVVAFSGRTLRSDNPAKYVNSPETDIYIKSRNLLGIYHAKAEISRQDCCILVEGNLDMVMMHQLGIKNVVASCGTSLTVEQVRLIHKFTENVTIMYDGDSAGVHAALRGLSLVLEEGLNVKIVQLPEGDDPDSFCRSHTLAEVQSYIADNEHDFIGFKSSLLLSSAGSDPLKRANLINDMADTIAVIPDPVKRSTYIDSVARQFGIESSILFDRVASTRRKEKTAASKPLRTPQSSSPASSQDSVPQSPETVDAAGEAPVLENPMLAMTEKDLLYFLLNFGDKTLEFPSDSPFYSEPPLTVCEFIREALEEDGTKMANSAYAALYDAYMQLYDSSADRDEILRSLMNSADRTIASLSSELGTEKYSLTMKELKGSLTATESYLVRQVPKTILCYAECRLRYALDCRRRSLATETDDQDKERIMKEMLRLQTALRKVRQQIGRERPIGQ